MRRPVIKSLVTLAVISVASSLSYAGSVAGNGGSTEVTQIVNEGELINTDLNTANSYMKQMQQYELMVRQAANLDPNFLNTLSPVTAASLKSVVTFSTNLKSLVGDLSNAKLATQNLFTDMSLKGLTPQQYVQQVVNNERGMRSHVQSMLDDINNSMQAVTSSYGNVKAYEAQNQLPVAAQQSAQLLNSQMDTLLVQNAKMQQTLSTQMESLAANQADQMTKQDAATQILIDQNAVNDARIKAFNKTLSQ